LGEWGRFLLGTVPIIPSPLRARCVFDNISVMNKIKLNGIAGRPSTGGNGRIRTIDEFRRKISFNVRISRRNGTRLDGIILRVEGENIIVASPLEERVNINDVTEARVLA